MSSFADMLWIELRKAFRSGMPLWTALASLFMPLAIGFLIFVSRNPEIAQNLLREAVQQLHATEVRVRADKNTHTILSRKALHEVAKELNVKIEDQRQIG